MRKTITQKWLRKLGACEECINWFNTKNTNSILDILRVIHEKPSFAFWLLSRVKLTKKLSIKIAAFAAELSLTTYVGPDRKILIAAIDAARNVLADNTEENRGAALAAARAARSISRSCRSASSASSASSAAALAESAADSATWASARAATEAAAWSVRSATDLVRSASAKSAAKSAAWKKILDYAIQGLETKEVPWAI